MFATVSRVTSRLGRYAALAKATPMLGFNRPTLPFQRTLTAYKPARLMRENCRVCSRDVVAERPIRHRSWDRYCRVSLSRSPRKTCIQMCRCVRPAIGSAGRDRSIRSSGAARALCVASLAETPTCAWCRTAYTATDAPACATTRAAARKAAGLAGHAVATIPTATSTCRGCAAGAVA